MISKCLSGSDSKKLNECVGRFLRPFFQNPMTGVFG